MKSYIGWNILSYLDEIHPKNHVLNEFVLMDEMVWLDEIEIGWNEVIGWNMTRGHIVIS
jgi:hypothetical protein